MHKRSGWLDGRKLDYQLHRESGTDISLASLLLMSSLRGTLGSLSVVLRDSLCHKDILACLLPWCTLLWREVGKRGCLEWRMEVGT